MIEGLPSLDQFDHMVVFVPSSEIGEAPNSMGGILIDATDKNSDPLLSPSSGLSNQRAFVLDPKDPRIVHTPKYASDAGKLTAKRHVTLQLSGSSVDAVVEEEVTFNPYFRSRNASVFEALRTAGTPRGDSKPARQWRTAPAETARHQEPGSDQRAARADARVCSPGQFSRIGVFELEVARWQPADDVGRRVFAGSVFGVAGETPFEIVLPRNVQSTMTNRFAGRLPIGGHRTLQRGRADEVCVLDVASLADGQDG